MWIYKTKYMEVKVYRIGFLFLSPPVLTLKFEKCSFASSYDLTATKSASEWWEKICLQSYQQKQKEKQSVPSRIPFNIFYKQRQASFASFFFVCLFSRHLLFGACILLISEKQSFVYMLLRCVFWSPAVNRKLPSQISQIKFSPNSLNKFHWIIIEQTVIHNFIFSLIWNVSFGKKLINYSTLSNTQLQVYLLMPDNFPFSDLKFA